MKTRCPQCRELIRSDALICRHCRHTLSVEERKAIGRSGNLASFGVIAVVAIIALTVSQTPKPNPGLVAAPEKTFEQKMAEAGAKIDEEDLVKTRLRDPESAVFKHLGGGCGYVNSRNGFGGMMGFQRYIAGTNGKVVFRSDGKHKAFDTVWRLHCEMMLTPKG